jgi:predicted nicotinamide N-methyase
VKAEALGPWLTERFATVERVVMLANGALTLRHPADAEALISEADFARDERLPYWADLWPSARVLADALIARHPAADAPPVRLLELGCGAGLVAAQAARLGFAVTATDYYDDATHFARWNAWVNSGRDIATATVDWRDLPSDLGLFDVVVASDVLYERPYGALVARAIRATLARRGVALLTDPGRVGAEGFVAECSALGLACGRVDRVVSTDGAVRHQVDVWQVTR